MEKAAYHPIRAELEEAFPKRTTITRQEAARYLRVDPRTLSRCKDFPLKKIGGRYVVSVVALARWMA